jgi:hypothetical protein
MQQAGSRRQGRADALMVAAYDKMGKASKPPAVPSSTRSASTAGTRCGSGRPRSAATCGAPPATSQPNWHRIYDILSEQAGLAKYAGPGHWNDPDMLEVGNGKLQLSAENRTHFSMWAMLAAPLLAGNDLPNMKPEIKAILTNRDVIAIDQDAWASRPRALTLMAKSRSGRGISPAEHGDRGHQRRQRPLLHAPFHLSLGQTRPARPAARQRPLDRQGHHAHRQHAD